MCLEALFSTTTSELSHKLAERVAYFAAKEPSVRRKLFEKTKAAHAVRSSILHGDEVSKRHRKSLEQTAQFCDDILRDILVRVFTSVETKQLIESSSEELEAKLTDLTLGLS